MQPNSQWINHLGLPRFQIYALEEIDAIVLHDLWLPSHQFHWRKHGKVSPRKGGLIAFFQKELCFDMFWPCFGKNMMFLLNLHPRRPQTVLPYPLQRLCACLSILAPDAGNVSSMSIQNNKQHFHMPHGYDYFCHGGICIWDKKRQGRRAVGDKC